MPVHGDARYLK